MKKIFIFIFLLVILFIVPLLAGDTLPVFLFWLSGPVEVVEDPAMDGVIANPATVKIANPGGQNLSIN